MLLPAACAGVCARGTWMQTRAGLREGAWSACLCQQPALESAQGAHGCRPVRACGKGRGQHASASSLRWSLRKGHMDADPRGLAGRGVVSLCQQPALESAQGAHGCRPVRACGKGRGQHACLCQQPALESAQGAHGCRLVRSFEQGQTHLHVLGTLMQSQQYAYACVYLFQVCVLERVE
jgi:hypothetical protein